MNEDHLSIKGCCRLAGGTEEPFHPSTIYRLIGKGLWPKPIHVGGSSRWRRTECEAALSQMAEARNV
jgi:predicted DNA-binding transcriptional regulator AlpA